ncbi:redoxin domain-containing protein [Massilia sp. CF038]|uniref:SCO family protein n=1 Tax=Massilia sp. CF038 TaxID=1881045 RepID=UPI000917D915|nr:redoxin domain-containing protein [Massilia sp. CF038]SHH26351.1 Peroxiredoxin [Massilia sp. CF038]
MEQNKPNQARGRWKLLAVLAVCASPLIFSYLTYYVIKPEGRTNYGDLIDPRTHPMPTLAVSELDGKPAALDAYKGKWVMLQVASGACDKQCTDQLIAMRQLRLMQGKGMERIERVWLVSDDTPLSIELMKWIDGTRILRLKPESLGNWLPVEQGGKVSDHMYIIDPLGNLMMRFPKDADPKKVSKDLGKLLKASAIG